MKAKNEFKSPERMLYVFVVENVYRSLVALPQIVIHCTDCKFAVGRFEIIQSPSDFDDPSVTQSENVKKKQKKKSKGIEMEGRILLF